MDRGLWVTKGVLPPQCWPKDSDSNFTNDIDAVVNTLIGTFAVDGSQGSPAQVERELLKWTQGNESDNLAQHSILNSLVAPRWCPNELKPFDAYAPDDPELFVSLSPSEKACALSHVATWKGIAACLPTKPGTSSFPSFVQGWTWAGFARGKPLHPPSAASTEQTQSPPTPVALVLEDDAILSNRFADRLEQVLQELPRDFHYCALGYARPKEGPLVDLPRCEHVKLPTMTWYLTGYLLSAAGARYLLRQLPVVGPVDAWMGRRVIMGSNWENDYGHRVGVGNKPVAGRDAISCSLTRKELQACLKFRAYCAGVPLCHQKVRTNAATGAGAGNIASEGQHWRHRDTDIVYSGNVGNSRKGKANSDRRFRVGRG